MKENLLQIFAAILLGLLVPGFMIRLTNKSFEFPVPETQYEEKAEEYTDPGIWVLTPDGTNQWMNLEEYLTGVILAEMPTSFAHDALCAQAVVARTYALKRQTEQKHPQSAVCTDPNCCQAYVDIPVYLDGLGFEEDVTVAANAVAATKGMVVTYQNALIEATYFHSSGGKTEEAVAVWGVDYPYLRAVDSPGEETLENSTFKRFYSREELERLLDRSLPGSPSGWLGWMTYTIGGGVETILLAGVQYRGVELRSLLKLNSTAFSIEADGDGLWFTTTGKGHRVGMSQNGAQAMALNQHTWQEIVAHYYPGTGIDKLEDVG